MSFFARSQSPQPVMAAPLPDELVGVDWLTPWAVALRYDEPEAALDRADAESACRWTKVLLDESAQEAP